MLCSFSSGGFAAAKQADTIFDAVEKTTPTRPGGKAGFAGPPLQTASGAEGVALCHDKASRGINTPAKQKDFILLEEAMAAKRHLLVEN